MEHPRRDAGRVHHRLRPTRMGHAAGSLARHGQAESWFVASTSDHARPRSRSRSRYPHEWPNGSGRRLPARIAARWAIQPDALTQLDLTNDKDLIMSIHRNPSAGRSTAG